MNKEMVIKKHHFTEGFLEDISYLLEQCNEYKDSEACVEIKLGDKTLEIEMHFNVHKLEADDESSD